MSMEIKRTDVLRLKYNGAAIKNRMAMALKVQMRTPTKENPIANMTVQYLVTLCDEDEDNSTAFEARIGIALIVDPPDDAKTPEMQQRLLQTTYPYFVNKINQITQALDMDEINLPSLDEFLSNSN